MKKGIKFKLQKRIKLSEQFNEIEQEEQHLLIQIIQTINKGKKFDFSDNPKNPYLNILWSLCGKSILNYNENDKKFTAPWLTHEKLNKDIVNRFLKFINTKITDSLQTPPTPHKTSQPHNT